MRLRRVSILVLFCVIFVLSNLLNFVSIFPKKSQDEAGSLFPPFEFIDFVKSNHFQRIVPIPRKNREGLAFRSTPWYTSNETKLGLSNCSKFQIGRDYEEDPILIQAGGLIKDRKWIECDVPCLTRKYDITIPFDGFMGHRRCPEQKSVIFSMESPIYYPFLTPEENSSYDIYATPILNSHVPVVYYSWSEYNFGKRVVPEKTANAMMATFITNCGAMNDRKAYLEKMIEYGVTIDSYGGCKIGNVMRNDKKGGNWNARKCDIIQNYKFVAAMENSNHPDYVTEKLFGPLAVGTIPIHMGDPNVHSLAPDNHSVISVHDFESPKHLAEYLQFLDKNETAYLSYMAWKKRGYSLNFKAKMDLSIVHSACRLCIAVADRHRWEIGPAKGEFSESLHPALPHGSDLGLLVRVRGTFWLEPVFLTWKKPVTSTFETLFHTLESLFCPEKHVLHEITLLTKTNPKPILRNDADVMALRNWTELELVVIQWPNEEEEVNLINGGCR